MVSARTTYAAAKDRIDKLVLNPRNPREVAMFLAAMWPDLVWRDGRGIWSSGDERVSEDLMEARVSEWLAAQLERDKKGRLVPFDATPDRVSAVLLALWRWVRR